jgi:parallel beta-helix repeat protein
MVNSHNNRVRLNIFNGNGAATSKPTPASPFSDNFGLGLFGGSTNNLVENNKLGGNVNGIYIHSSSAGNVFHRNVILGNPPVQVSNDFGNAIGADIQDFAPAGANTFDDNRCLTYAGQTTPAPCSGISNSDDEERGEQDIAAFGRNRLAFPQARLVNAVFHGRTHPLAKAAASAISRHAADSDSVTVTGKVVDAACYMLHVAAAMSVSHMECGAACLARGVPLAIATEDGVLYFPADGNQRLKSLLNARVRALGIVVEKHEPMELKMPVGDKNQMVVRVEGGYKQITIQTLERIPRAPRHPA